MKLKKLLAAVLTSMMVLSATSMTAFATDTTATVAPTAAANAAATVAPTQAADPYSGVGAYEAFFLIQTTTWVYRNAFTVDEYSKGDFNVVKGGPEETPFTAGSNVVTDAVLDGDGEYSVSISNADLKGSTNFNMVALSTNLPLDSAIKVTDATLYYDDVEMATKPAQKNDVKDYQLLMFINQYDNKIKDTVNNVCPPSGTNMVIKFKVEGFGYAKKAEATPTASATVTTAPAATTAPDAAATTKENGKKSGLSTGAIVGIIAGIAVIIVIATIVINSKKKK